MMHASVHVWIVLRGCLVIERSGDAVALRVRGAETGA
jgi:hypothetical protein